MYNGTSSTQLTRSFGAGQLNRRHCLTDEVGDGQLLGEVLEYSEGSGVGECGLYNFGDNWHQLNGALCIFRELFRRTSRCFDEACRWFEILRLQASAAAQLQATTTDNSQRQLPGAHTPTARWCPSKGGSYG